ncbi:MAG: hydroxyethylthiazole kinase [Mycobacterium leprae]
MKSLPARIKQARPLVHAITNYVTMDWVARGLLAAGARPVMALDKSEAGAMAAAANALYLNMGTWSPAQLEAMLVAGASANQHGVPVVLDPVGAGGLAVRTAAAIDLMSKIRMTAVRGNYGEILALAGTGGLVRGVDTATGDNNSAMVTRVAAAAKAVARRFGCIVAATGPIDVVSDGSRTVTVRSGHPIMGDIVGAGCLVSAIVAAAVAVEATLESVAGALLYEGIAGEEAVAVAQGPGTFEACLLDRLAAVSALPEDRITTLLADQLSVYVIVSGSTPSATLRQVLEAGVRCIQFREKQQSLPEQVNAARWMLELCRSYGALFLINDRVDLALALGADGVHVGQDDLPAHLARRILGPAAIVGVSCATPAEAALAEAEGADYIGTGPVYATGSKGDAGAPIGPAGLSVVCRSTSLPVVGIGGIGIGGAAPVVEAGAVGVSVISAVVGAQDPGAAARTLLAETKEALTK